MVTFPFTGGCISRGFKFRANILIAPSQAVSVRLLRVSRSMEGKISRSYASSAAARTKPMAGLPGTITRRRSR